MAIHSTVPLGAGVSSSAALEVATAFALCGLFNLTIDPAELAKICQKAENSFVGANCGLLDQFSSVFGKAGHLLFCDFRTIGHEAIPMAGSDVTLAVTLSGVTHSLVAGEYNSRLARVFRGGEILRGEGHRRQHAPRCVSSRRLLAAKAELDPQYFRRAMHVVGENERVFGGIEFIKKGAVREFGELLYQSHESSRCNFENSCDELDILVDIAKSVHDVYGSRLTGGGFGGATLTLMPASVQERFNETVTRVPKAHGPRDYGPFCENR